MISTSNLGFSRLRFDIFVLEFKFLEMYLSFDYKYQAKNNDIRYFAREVKGADLRSAGGNSAWVRTPQVPFLPRLMPRFIAASNKFLIFILKL